MNFWYDKIMALKEADEFKEVVRKWEILSSNMKKTPFKMPVILPDMLLVAKSGVGKTNLLNLMSEYLASKGNLMDFYGDVKFFEFSLGYCEPNMGFTELTRLIDEVNGAAGFRNEFRGIIRIDIDEWLFHFEEKYFADFCEYLAANSEKWLIVLSVYNDDDNALHSLEAFLSMYLRLERITLSLPKTEELFDYIEEKLALYGLTLAKDGKQLLSKTIETLRENRYFDGYKSVRMLCQDIAYSTFSKKDFKDYILTAEDLGTFTYDSEYVNRTVVNMEKLSRIGFTAQED